MPDWKYFRDRTGNSYFVDTLGKIYTPDRPADIIPPVSPESVEYDLSHGKQIIRSYPVEGLRILKSILALPEKNMIISKSRADAGSFINDYKKKHGNRFERWDRDASILLVVFDGMTHIYDDELRFSLEVPHMVTVLKNRERENLHYKYSGLSLGINADRGPGKNTGEFRQYDILAFIDAECFPSVLDNIDMLEENWRNNIGRDTFSRKKIVDAADKRIYEILHDEEPRICGYEAFYVNGTIGYMLRIISRKDFFFGKKDEINRILDSFTVIHK